MPEDPIAAALAPMGEAFANMGEAAKQAMSGWGAVIGMAYNVSRIIAPIAEEARRAQEERDYAHMSVVFVLFNHFDRALDVWWETHSQQRMLDAWKEDLELVFDEVVTLRPDAEPAKIQQLRDYSHAVMQKTVSERFVPTNWDRVRYPDL